MLSRCHGQVQSNLRRSDVARDAAVVGRHVAAEIEHDLIDITPAPALRRIIAFDDGMAGGVEVFGRVAMGRLIATPDMPADPAKTEMHPARMNLQALLAAKCARRHLADLRGMRAFLGPQGLPESAMRDCSSAALAR